MLSFKPEVVENLAAPQPTWSDFVCQQQRPDQVLTVAATMPSRKKKKEPARRAKTLAGEANEEVSQNNVRMARKLAEILPLGYQIRLCGSGMGAIARMVAVAANAHTVQHKCRVSTNA